MDNYDYLLKFPFSKEAREYIDSKNLNIIDISPVILEKLDLQFNKLFEIENHNRLFNIDEIKIKDKKINLEGELLIFPLSKIVLNIIDNTPLFQAFANYHQKRFIYFINKDYQLKNYDSIEKIIKDICPSISQNQKGFYISLVDLLTLDLGEEYKLQYTNLEEGNIYFPNKEQLIDFLAIVLKKRILRSTEINKKELPKSILQLSEKLKEQFMSIQRKKEDYNISKPNIGEFPPCFDKLYNDLMSGERLSHIANYHLAVFLCGVGYSYDEVLDVYRHLPNFDEKIAGYQIKKILEKKYSVANCETLRSNGLCVKDCKVKHPLQLLKKGISDEKT